MALLLKRLSLSLDTPIILLYLFAFTTAMFFIFNIQVGAGFSVSTSLLLLIICASVFAFAGNYFDLQALSLAPNAGYAAAIKGGQIILITAGAYFLFKGQSISISGVAGVFFIVLGITLLAVQGK